MKEFKGTKEVFAVEYAGTIFMNEAPYYESYNVLDMEHVGEEVALANAKLYEAAPDLLEALELVTEQLTIFSDMDVTNKEAVKYSLKKSKQAINKALGQ